MILPVSDSCRGSTLIPVCRNETDPKPGGARAVRLPPLCRIFTPRQITAPLIDTAARLVNPNL